MGIFTIPGDFIRHSNIGRRMKSIAELAISSLHDIGETRAFTSVFYELPRRRAHASIAEKRFKEFVKPGDTFL